MKDKTIISEIGRAKQETNKEKPQLKIKILNVLRIFIKETKFHLVSKNYTT